MSARIAAIPAVLLVAIAIWEAIAAQRAGAGVPDDDAWARAAAIVRAAHKPGDLIVFAPRWNDPVGRLHLGDLVPIEMAARMDAARYGRIWELSIRGARAPETAGLAPLETRDVDGIEVRRFERAPAEVLADLRDRAATAQLAPLGRSIAVELAEVGFEPHRCILAVPPPGNPLRITFAGLPAGTLVGYAGIADVFTRRDERRPARLAVEQAGRTIAEISPGVDDGWQRFTAPIAAGEVTVIVGSDAPNRLVCFAAEVRR